MAENAEIVCLIKPQFEAGREKVGKKGVVRDKKVHEEVIVAVTSFAVATGFELLRLDYSPIKGPEGNIEYLLYARKNERDAECTRNDSLQAILTGITEIVDAAHGDLDK
jgi:23S rRNA (cytidine1920-2'-O)/16S rRNA (cytidine1409-2'-O)-methyltransferase